ncbi:KTSC domain-containing protein [Methylomonas sp. AM2-LC]|uniref:KTSC domain-containing protein n=1 Tax=Methylomonas sp. AM2-LC TaxID=3153301 RepID=UPI003265092D
MSIPKLEKVESSNIEAVGHDSNSNSLYVLFKSKKLYSYYDVNQLTYNNLLNATSIGKFINRVIKKNHSSTLIDDCFEINVAQVNTKDKIRFIDLISLSQIESLIPDCWF